MAGTPTTGSATNTFAIDGTQRYQIVAQTFCKKITVQENFNSGSPATVDLLMAQPAGATQINISKGLAAVFTPAYSGSGMQQYVAGQFVPGQVVGELQTASGSITVQQTESTH